jgi:hypothetical protein
MFSLRAKADISSVAGIFFTKPFTDYTAEDFKSLVSTNLEGFLYVFGEINRDL